MRDSIWLLLAASATLLVADTHDARACSPPEQGVSSREVLPGDGATGVPRNARITVRYDAYQAEPQGTLSLRAQGGEPVAVTVTSPRDRGVTAQLTPTAPLAPSTTYEVLDTLTVPCNQFDLTPCIGEPVVVATFTTGAGLDTSPPQIADVSIENFFECGGDSSCGPYSSYVSHTLTFGGVQDDSGAAWVRYVYADADGNVLFGPTEDGYAIRHCEPSDGTSYREVPRTFTVRAIDLAGNVEEIAHVFETAPCDELDDGSPCDTDSGPLGCNTGGGGGIGAALAALLLVSRRRASR
jgi:hypothetical protein